MTLRDFFIPAIALGLWFSSAGAEPPEQGSVDIDFGFGVNDKVEPTRGGGIDKWTVTEDTLPAPGNKRRADALHILAARYAESAQWDLACRKYQRIEEEGAGIEAITKPSSKHASEATRLAAKAYFHCGRLAGNKKEWTQAEKWLRQSEAVQGEKSTKHAALLRRHLRDQYRGKLAANDLEGTLTLYQKYQSQGAPNEDERIWLGENLGARALAAHKSGDHKQRDSLLAVLDQVAPQNTDYRMILTDMKGTANFARNVGILAGALIVGFLLFKLMSKAKNRKPMEVEEDEYGLVAGDDGVS